jgi:hypothetical protein
MRVVKLIFAVAIFVTALSVFLMSPERQTELLETLGISLKQRAFFALSILVHFQDTFCLRCSTWSHAK